jgi:flagellar hook-basal body complex protein FliE
MNVNLSQIPEPIIDFQPAKGTAGEANSGFMKTLGDAIEEVERLQASADGQVTGLLNGGGQDIHSTMIAVEKADIAFQMMMQVRNKIVNAYQEISRMQF